MQAVRCVVVDVLKLLTCLETVQIDARIKRSEVLLVIGFGVELIYTDCQLRNILDSHMKRNLFVYLKRFFIRF